MGTSAVAIRERQIVKAFRRIGAITPYSAVSPHEIGVRRRVAFRRLLRCQVLIEADEGTYYLHEPAWHDLRSTRRRLLVTMLLIVAIAGIVTWLKIR